MTPVVVMPSPLKLAVDLLRAHPQLPTALANQKVCVTLPDAFPAGCPYLQVSQAPAGPRPVPLRLAVAHLDFNLYDSDLWTSGELARQVAGLVLSLEGQSTADGGFTQVLVSEPYPLADPDTTTPRYLVTAQVTYRPRL